MSKTVSQFTNAEILAGRPDKNVVDPHRPYAYLFEQERSAQGEIVDVATIFLTNRECPFRCLMCDLWKNTTDQRVPAGAIPEQIDFAISQLSPAQQIKLYNSGNFFDDQAIPAEDWTTITTRVRDYENVIVENHPKLCGERCRQFRDQTETNLEIALGLETIHADVLPALNKSMTLGDFDRAVDLLLADDIALRSFILLKPPFLTEVEGVDWALRSIEYAFRRGVECCSVIATRAGNGIMEQLETEGRFSPPALSSLEQVLENGIQLGQGRVFVDLWDAERFADCAKCAKPRIQRMHQMNLQQQVLPAIECKCGVRQ